MRASVSIAALAALLCCLSGCKGSSSSSRSDRWATLQAISDGTEAHEAWSPDEEIAVFDNGKPVRFRIVDYDGALSGFAGETAVDADPLTALFPYSAEASFDGGTVSCEIPALQSVSELTPDVMAAVSVGRANAGSAMMFKAAYAFVSIPLKSSDMVSRVTLSALDREPLSGQCGIEVSTTPSAVPTVEGGTVSIVPSEGSFFATGRYLAIVAPCSLHGGLRAILDNAQGKQGAVDIDVSGGPGREETLRLDDSIFDTVVWRTGGLSLGGSVISPVNNAYGLITDSSTGKGVSGVPVTDGFHFVTSDDNGVWQMQTSEGARNVYYTLPSGYEPTLDKDSHRPVFWGEIKSDALCRCDFSITPAAYSQESFTLLMMGDPQMQTETHVRRFNTETIPDLVSTLDSCQALGQYPHVYGVALGDTGYDNDAIWPQLKEATSNIALAGGVYIPLYQVMGNHDKDSLSEDDPDGLFVRTFGPKDYSFNIGKVHVVVMDNVRETSRRSAPEYPNGYSWDYGSGLTAAQLEWLREDLALVEDKADKALVFCVHIPVRNTSMGKSVLPLFTPFRECHIMSAHTHYPLNHIHSSYVCAGGQPIYEHVHGAACGAFWRSNINKDGQPQGYSLYEVEGSSIRNWIAKGTGCDMGLQLRVYDGNDTYPGSYTYRWYEVSLMGGSTSVYVTGNSHLRNAFVASVWNDDPSNWSLELWQNGSKVGDFTRLAPGGACDVCATSFFSNILNRQYSIATAGHIWYYVPASHDPSGEKDWEVVARQTIPGSGVTNTYRASSLQKDYTGFAVR